jgi:hypothetical protein
MCALYMLLVVVIVHRDITANIEMACFGGMTSSSNNNSNANSWRNNSSSNNISSVMEHERIANALMLFYEKVSITVIYTGYSTQC